MFSFLMDFIQWCRGRMLCIPTVKDVFLQLSAKAHSARGGAESPPSPQQALLFLTMIFRGKL